MLDCWKPLYLVLSGIALCLCPSLKASTGTPVDFGAKADGVTVDYEAIQQAVNAFDVVIFPAGTYLIDDRDYIRVPGNRTLLFEKGSVIKFVNKKGRRFGAVFYMTGDDICIDGLVFESPSMISREYFSTSDKRAGKSSLATVIMSGGNRIVFKDITIRNAEFGFFLSGNQYSLSNIDVVGAQPLYADHCSNLSIQGFRSQLPGGVSSLDHHIYLKGDCRNVTIDSCEFTGGPSFAVQLSADYSDPEKCPKNVRITRTSVLDSSKFIVIDEGNTDVTCETLDCQGIAGDSQSFFASNRGGRLVVKDSNIQGFTYVERDHSLHAAGRRGQSSYSGCKFSFMTPESCAFDLSSLDNMDIDRCKFTFNGGLKDARSIVRIDRILNRVGKVRIARSSFFVRQHVDSPVKIAFSDKKVVITRNNKFYRLGENGGVQ